MQDLPHHSTILHLFAKLTQAGDEPIDVHCEVIDGLPVAECDILILLQEALQAHELVAIIADPHLLLYLPHFFC
jgi:hypothetical protein